MNTDLIPWLFLAPIGPFDIWLVATGKRSISKWTEQRWPRVVDAAIAIGWIVIKTGILNLPVLAGGALYSFDPLLGLLLGHMLLGHEIYGDRVDKRPWNRWERWAVYYSVTTLAALAIISIL